MTKREIKMGKIDKELQDICEPQYEDETEQFIHAHVEYEAVYRSPEEEYLIDTVMLLHDKLTKYAKYEAYPLCEHLDVYDVEDYVRLLLRKS